MPSFLAGRASHHLTYCPCLLLRVKREKSHSNSSAVFFDFLHAELLDDFPCVALTLSNNHVGNNTCTRLILSSQYIGQQTF